MPHWLGGGGGGMTSAWRSGLVQVGSMLSMKSTPSSAFDSRSPSGAEHRVARDGDQRADPTVAGRVDLLGECGGRELRPPPDTRTPGCASGR